MCALVSCKHNKFPCQQMAFFVLKFRKQARSGCRAPPEVPALVRHFSSVSGSRLFRRSKNLLSTCKHAQNGTKPPISPKSAGQRVDPPVFQKVLFFWGFPPFSARLHVLGQQQICMHHNFLAPETVGKG